MALDQRSNWTVSMAENLDLVKRNARDSTGRSRRYGDNGGERSSEAVPSERQERTWHSEPVYLPDEVLLQILEYTSQHREAQQTLAACCLLSHQWYDAAVPFLYRHPRLYGKNYDPFVRAICPSINLHVRKSPLSGLVRVLDMGGLVHHGSKSLTARLLGRTKDHLEEFVAPQASFAVNCFPALSKCHQLRTLDLSLVSESPPLPDLFKTVAHLQRLTTFRLPRSSGFGVHYKPESFAWPPNLEDLSLSGGIDAHFQQGIVQFPATLRSLTIEHCPLAKSFAVMHLIKTAVRPLVNLESFKIRNMPRLGSHALDGVLLLLPQIRKLSVSVDYVTPALFDECHFHHVKEWIEFPAGEEGTTQPFQHQNLRTLELTVSGSSGVEDKISPIDIMIAMDEGSLPKLRQVRASKFLLWQSSSTASDAEALADALQEGSKSDWEKREWIFAEMPEKEYAQADWEAVSGVWSFDG